MFRALDIAEVLRRRTQQSLGAAPSPMRLVKLVYFAHALHLALYDEPLLYDAVEAWELGPMIPSLYPAIKDYGTDPVATVAGHQPLPPFKPRVESLLEQIVKMYAPLSAQELSALTRTDEGPWSITRSLAKRNAIIPDVLLRQFYRLALLEVSAPPLPLPTDTPPPAPPAPPPESGTVVPFRRRH